METCIQLIVVAYARSTGGRVRLLFAMDHDGAQLHEGEPVLLAEHHPAEAANAVDFEGAVVVAPQLVEHVRTHAPQAVASLVDAAFDATGEWVPERILGRSIELVTSRDLLEP